MVETGEKMKWCVIVKSVVATAKKKSIAVGLRWSKKRNGERECWSCCCCCFNCWQRLAMKVYLNDSLQFNSVLIDDRMARRTCDSSAQICIGEDRDLSSLAKRKKKYKMKREKVREKRTAVSMLLSFLLSSCILRYGRFLFSDSGDVLLQFTLFHPIIRWIAAHFVVTVVG